MDFISQQLRPKQKVLFPEIDWAEIFYHLPARNVECVPEYIFNFKTTTIKKQEDKKQKKLKKKREYLW